MGLAAPKKRRKISHDPNNTEWTRSTSKFGHRILASQGWSPGEFLGAKDSSHAQLHTQANSVPIRVSFKDDNLGLGARIGGGALSGHCVGLDAYQGLLGRLNDKGEQTLKAEAKARSAFKRNDYLERRWGASLTMNFVTGGMLDEDEVSKLVEQSRGARTKSTEADQEKSPRDSSTANPEKELKKRTKKGRKLREDLEIQQGAGHTDNDEGSRAASIISANESETTRARRKAERRARKQAMMEIAAIAERESLEKSHETTRGSQQNIESRTERPQSSRHALRNKHIRQKKLATADHKALNEILMIKVHD